MIPLRACILIYSFRSAKLKIVNLHCCFIQIELLRGVHMKKNLFSMKRKSIYIIVLVILSFVMLSILHLPMLMKKPSYAEASEAIVMNRLLASNEMSSVKYCGNNEVSYFTTNEILSQNDTLIFQSPYVEYYSSNTRSEFSYVYEKTVRMKINNDYVQAEYYKGPRMFIFLKRLTNNTYWEGAASKIEQITLGWSQSISVASTESHNISAQIGLSVPIYGAKLSASVGYTYSTAHTYTTQESQSNSVVINRNSPAGYYCLGSYIDANQYLVKVSLYTDSNYTRLKERKADAYTAVYNTDLLSVKYRYRADKPFSSTDFIQ